MFQVQFMAEDDKFGPVMALLAGKVMELKWKHITNAKAKNGKVVAEHNAGSIREAVLPAMMKAFPEMKKDGRFTMDMLAATIEKLGGSAKSKGTQITAMMKLKIVKRVGRGTYALVRR